MSTPIQIEFKLSGSNKVETGELLGYRHFGVRIRQAGVVTWYSVHFIDWVREV